MSVSVAGIPKNRCRTTIAKRIGETRAELPFTRDQVGLLRPQPGGPRGVRKQMSTVRMTCAIPLISIVIASRLLRHAASQPRPRHLSAADRFRFGARLGFVLRRHRIPAPQLRCTDCAYRTLHDCRQFYFDVRDESISFKEFLLLIFHFYSTSYAIIRW